MLWRPVTPGEHVFLRLYEGLGAHLEISGPQDVGLAFLVAEQRFSEFVRLAATLEVFMRCVRAAQEFVATDGHLPAARIGRRLREDADLPARLYNDPVFCEHAKQAGKISADKRRKGSVERNAMRSEAPFCYLCGIPLTQPGQARSSFTVEHLWPMTFGGDTVEDNLLPACKDCNEKRNHSITWAWGPVQSTYHARSSTEDLPGELRLSLALAKLMLVAGGNPNPRARSTLKQAAKRAAPLVTPLNVETNRRYLYFDLLTQIETDL